MKEQLPLLIVLLVCHYLADFCFTWPGLIRAKADGRAPWPILLHAGIHAALSVVCLSLWSVGWKLLLMLAVLELVTHFLIDWGKGYVSVRYPGLSDRNQKPYWMLHGVDQLLHLLVVVFIWHSCVTF